jgi:hypothetical protein
MADVSKNLRDSLLKQISQIPAKDSTAGQDYLGKAYTQDFESLSKKLPENEMKENKKLNAKRQFAKDLQSDPDFADFKERAKYGPTSSETYGTPNATSDDPFIQKRKYKRVGKEEELDEKWSKKYKDSIDCSNPKGFSQRAHCQGKKKKQMSEEVLKGGKADNKTFEELVNKYKTKGKDIKIVEKELKNQLSKGINVEMEHTDNRKRAKEIAMDHLFEDPKYYDKLKKIESKEATATGGGTGAFEAPFAFKDSEFVRNSLKEKPKKVETKEATGSASVGAYSQPSIWAKSMSKKDFRGYDKPVLPGGKFVTVKKKCKTFPYCNQGDIKALKIFENELVKEVISNLSKKYQISESVIKNLIIDDIKNRNN